MDKKYTEVPPEAELKQLMGFVMWKGKPMEKKKKEIAARLGRVRKQIMEKMGHWKWVRNEGETEWACSECGYRYKSATYPLEDRMNFCPECGTRMRDDNIPFYDSEAEV